MINNIAEQIWYLFYKHVSETAELPPIRGTLKHHIQRAHIQTTVQPRVSQSKIYLTLAKWIRHGLEQ